MTMYSGNNLAIYEKIPYNTIADVGDRAFFSPPFPCVGIIRASLVSFLNTVSFQGHGIFICPVGIADRETIRKKCNS